MKTRWSRNLVGRDMEESQILRSVEAVAIQLRDCNTFHDIMLTGPSAMDVNTKMCKWLYDFNIVPGHGHKGTRSKEVSVVWIL